MLDSERAMETFLSSSRRNPRLRASRSWSTRPKWSVIEAGLKCMQGKAVVNSISMKEGEAEFLDKARLVRSYGAAAVVMAFDEQGAGRHSRAKVSIFSAPIGSSPSRRASRRPTSSSTRTSSAVATGIEEHNRYAIYYIEAVRQIKATCPGALISGRHLESLVLVPRATTWCARRCIRPSSTTPSRPAWTWASSTPASWCLRRHPEELLGARRGRPLRPPPDATERLVEIAEQVKGSGKKREIDLAWREASVEQRLIHALVHGVVDFIEADVEEARQQAERPLHVIEGPLMDACGSSATSLAPARCSCQVVKSARAMKRAVGRADALHGGREGAARSAGRS